MFDVAVEALDDDPTLAPGADDLKFTVFDEFPSLIVTDAAEKLAGLADGNEEGAEIIYHLRCSNRPMRAVSLRAYRPPGLQMTVETARRCVPEGWAEPLTRGRRAMAGLCCDPRLGGTRLGWSGRRDQRFSSGGGYKAPCRSRRARPPQYRLVLVHRQLLSYVEKHQG